MKLAGKWSQIDLPNLDTYKFSFAVSKSGLLVPYAKEISRFVCPLSKKVKISHNPIFKFVAETFELTVGEINICVRDSVLELS